MSSHRDALISPISSANKLDKTLKLKEMNHDILCLAMAAAAETSAATVSAMMRTCRDLYHEGPRVLLAMDIPLQTPAHFVSYAAFVQSHSGERTSLVKFLHLSPADSITLDLIERIAALIRAMANIECMHLDDINGYPDLCAAIAMRSSIKHLAIANVGKETYRMLGDLRSQLHTLRVDSQTHFMYTSDVLPAVLTHSSETLRRFEAAHIWIDPPPPSSRSFSRVHSLVLSDSQRVSWTAMSLGTGMDYFPHLQRLRAYFAHGHSPYSRAQERAENQLAQDETGLWRSLREVQGSAEALYTLGLRCQCEALHVVVSRDEIVEDLPLIFADIAPLRLTLALDSRYGTRLTMDGYRGVLVALLRARSLAPRLQDVCIVFGIELHNLSARENVQRNLDLVVEIVQELALASFTIELYPTNLISTETTLTAADVEVIEDLNLSCSGITGDRVRFSLISPEHYNTPADGPFKLCPALWQSRWTLTD
ncbi:hypothetical protein VTO73DRAFT_28 [Trametes versicolor]